MTIEQRLAEAEKLLQMSRSVIRDLAESLGNACEFFEGEDDEDPQAKDECDEARKFARRIEEFLKP